jgi:two-component system, chemotaxis family, sensor kinase CheA
MQPVLPLPADRLLAINGLVALQIDAQCNVLALHNLSVLTAWLPPDWRSEPGQSLASLLEQLLEPAQCEILLRRCASMESTAEGADLRVLSAAPGKMQRLAAQRYFDVWIERIDGASTQSVVLMADVSPQCMAVQGLEEARAAADLALTVLRSDAAALRLFLQSAQTAVGKIRSTLKMPARSQDAIRDKLARLLSEAQTMQSGATTLELHAIATASQSLVDLLQGLITRDALSGDDLLPLSPRIDPLSAAIGAAARIDEQRPEAVARAKRNTSRTGSRKTLAWPEASERRWSDFLVRKGEETGKLALLKMTGAQHVPATIHRHVDEMLESLLGNALEHGIEAPDLRVKADKPAAGQITVNFESRGAEGIEMTVHDDGNGFDLDRIGRAAVNSGILAEDALASTDPGLLVGLVFKPAFTTAGLDDSFGQGRGMAKVRSSVTRLGGHVSVATKQRRYTKFTIRLPVASERASRRHR